MPSLTAREAAGVVGGGELRGDPDARATAFVAHSRRCGPGTAFVAVRGGHDYVSEALGAGAPFVLVERAEVLPADASGVVVDDTVRALAELARWWRRRLDVRVIGITGSTGKTLTKDLIAAALSPRYRIHASPGSYNNEIGVPLVVLSSPEGTEVLVAELGARREGDIAALAEVVRPDVGVLTGVGVTHLGVFGSRWAIARTKAELLEALPASGTAVLPSGDDFLDLAVSATAARAVTVGPGGHVRFSAGLLDGRGRAEAVIDLGDRGVARVRSPVPGRAVLRNVAMALATAVELGVDPGQAAEALEGAPLSAWRLEVHAAGARVVVNDAYNANPTSTTAALRTLWELAGERPAWAVLGEMAELGPIAHREHVRIGRLARDLGITGVVVVGDGAAGVAEGYGPASRLVPDAEAAAELVLEEAPPDAVILVKASRVAGLERTAERLKDEPSESGVGGR